MAWVKFKRYGLRGWYSSEFPCRSTGEYLSQLNQRCGRAWVGLPITAIVGTFIETFNHIFQMGVGPGRKKLGSYSTNFGGVC